MTPINTDAEWDVASDNIQTEEHAPLVPDQSFF